MANAIILTLAASARSSVPTEHPGKISSVPTTLFGVPGITGHTICRTLYIVHDYKKMVNERKTGYGSNNELLFVQDYKHMTTNTPMIRYTFTTCQMST